MRRRMRRTWQDLMDWLADVPVTDDELKRELAAEGRTIDDLDAVWRSATQGAARPRKGSKGKARPAARAGTLLTGWMERCRLTSERLVQCWKCSIESVRAALGAQDAVDRHNYPLVAEALSVRLGIKARHLRDAFSDELERRSKDVMRAAAAREGRREL